MLNPNVVPSPGLNLVAAELWLDFTNTVDWHASDAPQELLGRYEDLIVWSRRAGLLDAAASGQLLREATRRPVAAAAVLKRAIAVRESLYRIAIAVLRERPPAADDLGRFNRELKAALAHLQVVNGPGGCTWSWESGAGELGAMLWPVLCSAADLLTSERRRRIGQCADDRGCGWLFLDTTRNRSRRWCEMADCGNRAKARRHYRRRRGPAARDK
jgi:predicted RNA-binding Zn ribbon-like protein